MKKWCAYFPLVESHYRNDDVVKTIEKWMTGSRYIPFEKEEIEEFFQRVFQSDEIRTRRMYDEIRTEKGFKKANLKGGIITNCLKKEEGFSVNERIGIIYSIDDGGTVYTTDIGIINDEEKRTRHAYISLDVEQKDLKGKNVVHRKPLIINKLINSVGGGRDGEILIVKATPHEIDDISMANYMYYEILKEGSNKRMLPLIYISKNRNGITLIEPDEIYRIARDLGGIAHVITEESPEYSKMLWSKNRERGVTGGTIGIYYPNGWIERIVPVTEHTEKLRGKDGFFFEDNFKGYRGLSRFIIQRIREASCRKLKPREIRASTIINNVNLELMRERHGTKEELDKMTKEQREYIALLEEDNDSLRKDIKAIEEREQTLKKENMELMAKLQNIQITLEQYKKRYEKSQEMENKQTVNVKVGNLVELYDGEIPHMILTALEKAFKQQPTGTRPKEIFKSILEEHKEEINKYQERQRRTIEEIKNIFKDKETGKRIRNLKQLGFEVTRDDHGCIRVPGMNNIAESMSGTPGKGREDKNAPQNIVKRFLYKSK